MAALRAVFVAREGRLLGALAAKMRGISGEAVFDTWMKRESDLVQATAQAYAEREVVDACLRAMQQVRPSLILSMSWFRFSGSCGGVCADFVCILADASIGSREGPQLFSFG